jgi:hypothetical protein
VLQEIGVKSMFDRIVEWLLRRRYRSFALVGVEVVSETNNGEQTISICNVPTHCICLKEADAARIYEKLNELIGHMKDKGIEEFIENCKMNIYQDNVVKLNKGEIK